MQVVKQGSITSPEDITALDIIDWSRLNGSWQHPGQAIQAIASWFIDGASYTVIQHNMRYAPACNDFPRWKHVGDHESLAQLFWNDFHATKNMHNGELFLSDEPDFYGSLNFDGRKHQLWGDFGMVSAQVFAITQKKMNAGDLWISILDYQTQVIIEAAYDIQAAAAATLGIR